MILLGKLNIFKANELEKHKLCIYNIISINSRQTMMIIVLVMTFILGSMLTWKRCVECRQIITESQEINQYNNITSNPAILNPMQYVFIAFTLLITTFGWHYMTEDVLKTYPWLIGLRELPRIFLIMFILPIIFYANKEKARLHIKMVFWDAAPDFLQRYNPNNLIQANV